MKNHLVNKLSAAVFALIFLSVNTACAVPSRLEPLKGSISNFVLVMIGIIFFMGLIFVGLTVYNKLFVPKNISNYELRKYNLSDSQDKDEAVLNYISKNRLR